MELSTDTLVRTALEEDLGRGDITTEATVPRDVRCRARLVAKQDGVLSGIEVFHRAFVMLDPDLCGWESLQDGAAVKPDDTIARFEGRAQAVLMAERTAMNFVQHLSGVATLTARFVAAVGELNCKICCTRKTTPLLRALEKAAVVHGGGTRHRFNLSDGILIKENHVTAAGGLHAAITKARRHSHHLMRVEAEVRNLQEFDEAVEAGADVILLDNMGLDTMREAVRRAAGRQIVLEASGNASLDRVHAIAETGVDFISVGALTHSAAVLDMSLLIENA
ncbi:MAG TPA: carboxylating nicotinate-nucleotide diphosphorylase [Candidatus Hydrogenedentes bacterium]|nr:carboxylating nicotinate-nucleotide diphosphorylase [Candidatus Hydrogenedentota bacterium]